MKTAIEIFADNLNYFLSKNQKTQSDLAKYMHVSTATASDWCNAKKMPRVDKLKSIANYFHINLSDLVDDRRDDTYYLDTESAEIVNFMKQNPDYKVLFDAVQDVRPEDINLVKSLIERMTKE